MYIHTYVHIIQVHIIQAHKYISYKYILRNGALNRLEVLIPWHDNAGMG